MRLYNDRLLALCILLVALGLNLYHLSGRSIAFDEAFSIDLARQPVDVILRAGWGNEAHMTLYYLLLHDWLQITSSLGIASTETVVRLISAISSAIGAVTLFLLAWRFMGRWVAVLSTTLYVCSFAQLRYAQFTRSYALQLALGCLSWYALIYALPYATRRPAGTPRFQTMVWWALYIVITTIFIYAQIFSVLVVVGQAVAFILICLVPNMWQELALRQIKAFIGSILAVGLLTGPILIDGLIHGGNNGWVPDATLGSILPIITGLLYKATGGIYNLLGILFVVLVLTLCLSALLTPLARGLAAEMDEIGQLGGQDDDGRYIARTPSPARRSPGGDMPWEVAVIIAACWFLVPFTLAFLGTLPIHNLHLFYERYLVVTLPGLFLLVALGVQAMPWLPLRVVPTVMLLAIAIATLPNYYDTFQTAGTWDVRGAMHWVEGKYQPNDGIVCLPAYYCSVPVQYYMSRDRQLAQGQIRFDNSPGQYHWNPPWLSRANAATIAAYAANHSRIFVITVAYGSPGVSSAWLAQHYDLQSTYTTDMVTVRLYSTHSVPQAMKTTPTILSTVALSAVAVCHRMPDGGQGSQQCQRHECVMGIFSWTTRAWRHDCYGTFSR